MNEEKRITYQAGITRTPSDFLCKDGELAECINLTTDNQELKPIVQPKEKMTVVSGYLLVYVHSHNDTTRYILRKVTNSTLYWTLDTSSEAAYNHMMAVNAATLQIQSIGNTLIVASSSGMGYFLWKGGTYNYLGAEIPDIRVDFSLGDFGYLSGTDANPNKYGRVPGMHGEILLKIPRPGYIDEYAGNVWGSEDTENDRKWDSGYEIGKDALVGIVSAQLDWVKEKKRFAFPFWARSAVRLYDGTHARISNPFLLLPTVLNNWHIFAYDPETDGPKVIDGDAGGYWITAYRPYCAKLYYSTNYGAQDLSDWEDIISGVDIFVSEEVKSFDLNGGWNIINNCVRPNSMTTTLGTVDACMPQYGVLASMPAFVDNDANTWQTFYQPSLLSEGEMTHRLLEKSVFYKIIELDFNEMLDTSQKDATSKIDRGALKNLVNNQTLKNDDYFSNSYMRPQVIKAYNNRLHLADVKRSIFWGFGKFSYTAHTDSQNRKFYVHIRTEDGTKVVSVTDGSSYEIGDIWFYYPDPRAFKAEVFVGTNRIYTLALKEHPYLNGAYYFGHLPDSYGAWPSGVVATAPTLNNTPELLEGKIIVSEVDNPWVFTAKGHVTVGRGRILGMASQTVALGQEEHGIHPLVVFSERGISTLRLDNEGVYQRSDELSREVCINPSSIIETDGAIYFVSKKGLMVLVGESVKCVSAQMNGPIFDYKEKLPNLTTGTDWSGVVGSCYDDENFLKYISSNGLVMAYDYIDQRIIMVDNSLYDFAFVYNIQDGTISKTVLPATIKNAVNNYPDYFLQGDTTEIIQEEGEEPQTVTVRKVFSLYEKLREDEVGNRQLAFVLTRPLKLAGPVSQASLRELMNVGMWQEKDNNGNNLSCVKTQVYVSSDLRKWYRDESRFGAAARYYRLALYIKMLPTERLSGTIITSQERRGDNMR